MEGSQRQHFVFPSAEHGVPGESKSGQAAFFGRWWLTCQCLQQVSYSCLLLLRCEVKVQRLSIAALPARDGQAQRHSGCTRSMRLRHSPQFVQEG